MSEYNDLVTALLELTTNRFSPKPFFNRGILGDGQGNVIVPDRPDKSYVRFNRGANEFFEVFNRTVNPVEGWPVLIGELPWQPGLTQVVDTDWAAFEQSGWGDNIGSTSPHAPTHEWPDGSPGSDPLNVYMRSVVPLRSYASNTGTVVFTNSYEYEYQGSGHVWGGTPGLDLSPVITSMPSGTMRFMGIYLDPSTNTLGVVTGTTTVFTSAFDPPRVQFPANVMPSARVRVYGSQANVNEADMRDARQPFLPVIPVSGAAWPFDKVVTVSQTNAAADYSTIQSAHNGEAAGTAILLDVGTYTENVTISKKITLFAFDSQNTILTAASGTTLTITASCDVFNMTINRTGGGAGNAVDTSTAAYAKLSNCIIASSSSDPAVSISGIGTTGYLYACDVSSSVDSAVYAVNTGCICYAFLGSYDGATFDFERGSGATLRLNSPVSVNKTFSGTIVGRAVSTTGAMILPYDSTPANADFLQWDGVNSREYWVTGTVSGGNVWPKADEAGISNVQYTSISNFFDAIASGVQGIIGEGSYTIDYAGGHGTLDSGADLLGSGIDVTILTSTTGTYTIDAAGNNHLEDLTIINTSATSLSAIIMGGSGGGSEMKRVKVTGSGTSGIYISGASVTLKNCESTASEALHLFTAGTNTVTVRGGYYDGDVIAEGAGATIYLDGPVVTGSITESSGGTITGWYKNASLEIIERDALDIYPQQSTNGLNARFERLFGDDKPANTYRYTLRTFFVNNVGSNIIGFEDNQATPYAPPAGNFTITTPANTTTASTSHWLDLFNLTSASPCYLEWTNSTAKNTFVSVVSVSPFATGADTLIAEARFWAVQTPTANDRWWALRWVWYGSTRTQYPFQVSAWYSAAVGDGLTFAATTGTKIAEGPIIPGGVYRFSFIAAAGPTAYFNVVLSEGFDSFVTSATVASMPTSIKTARYMTFQQFNQFFIDQLQVT